MSPVVTGDLLATRTVTFDWTPSTGDVFDYKLQVTSGDFNTRPFDVDIPILHPITGDRVTLPGDGTYRWRVTARDEAFNAATSDTRTFTVDTTPPAAPVLVTPVAAPARESFLNTNTPFFDWEASASTGDVFGYRLQASRTRTELSLGVFVIDKVFTGDFTQFQVPIGDALADGRYVWRVLARDEAQNASPSEFRIFTVDTRDPGLPLLVAPADNALLSISTPLFEWEPTILDVFDYILQVTSASGDINTAPLDLEVIIRIQPSGFQTTGTCPMLHISGA